MTAYPCESVFGDVDDFNKFEEIARHCRQEQTLFGATHLPNDQKDLPSVFIPPPNAFKSLASQLAMEIHDHTFNTVASARKFVPEQPNNKGKE